MDNKISYVKLYPKTEQIECPFCHIKDDFEDGLLIWQDYVDIPMIWCWDCKKGNESTYISHNKNYATSHSFLDPIFFDKYFSSYYKINNYHKSFDKLYRGTIDYEGVYEASEKLKSTLPDDFCVNIPLLYIERICDRNMSEYVSDKKLSDEEVIDILNNNYSEDVIKKYNLIKCSGCRTGEEDLMNISLPIGSYRIETPLVKYPDNLDQSHDGTVINCLVRLSDGSLKQVKYWGD